MRVGIGYDIHRLVKGESLFLGGIEIPFKKELSGHSDGDVLLHAVCDGLLGAAGLSDIGKHFPDTDPKYKNISSVEILKETNKMLKAAGFKIINIDSIVICEKPRIQFYREDMVQSICSVLGRKVKVSVKGKTAEGLGIIGKEEAIAAYSVCLIKEEEKK